MKKLYILVVCVIFCFASGCTLYGRNTGDISSNSQRDREIIDSGKYYRIYAAGATGVRYEIYNRNGNTVFSDSTDRPLTIEMLEPNIVDIKIGIGTGIEIHRYYNTSKNLFSKDFTYVLTATNRYVAYISVKEKNVFEDRKIIVRDIFDKDAYYKEYRLDLAKTDTPVVEAEFTEGGNKAELKVIYLSADNEKTVVLS